MQSRLRLEELSAGCARNPAASATVLSFRLNADVADGSEAPGEDRIPL